MSRDTKAAARRMRGRGRPRMEPLEGRLLLSGDLLCVTSIVADNRGQIVLAFAGPVRSSSLNQNSVQVTTAGADGLIGTDDDVRVSTSISIGADRRTVTIRANTPADARYGVRLVASEIKGEQGNEFDGEFNGADELTGDGVAGGDLVFFTRAPVTQIARITTVLGDIDVELFRQETPLTVANFLSYANAGVWDSTFFHRLVSNFVIQGGGFTSSGDFPRIPQNAPVQNEPGISNVRGTIAMAKLSGNPDSATNEWFFNLGDNSDNLDNQNGGFTVFGEITDNRGLAVMDALASLDIIDASAQGGAFGELPVLDADAVTENGGVVRPSDLAVITRVALLMDVTAEPFQQISADGAFVVQNAAGTAQVMLLDLTGDGLPDLSDSFQVRFNGNSVSSIIIRDPFPDVEVGIQFTGVNAVGSITDLRRQGLGQIRFIYSPVRIGSIRVNGITGMNLNGFVLPGGINLDIDIDGDGDVSDPVAVLVDSDGSTTGLQSLVINGNLTGDVIAPGGLISVQVSGETTNADFVIGSSPSRSPVSTAFRFGRVSDSSITSEMTIRSLFATDWRTVNGARRTITAPSLYTLTTTGELSVNLDLDGSDGAFRTIQTVRTGGDISGGTWTIGGHVGAVSAAGAISGLVLDVTDGDVQSVIARSMAATTIRASGRITQLSTSEFMGGTIEATRMTTLSIRGNAAQGTSGDFSGELRLTNFDNNIPVISSANISGDVRDSRFTIRGILNRFTIGGDISATEWDHTGNIRFLSAKQVDGLRLGVSNAMESLTFTSARNVKFEGLNFARITITGDRRLGIDGDFFGDIDINAIDTLMLQNNGDLSGDINLRFLRRMSVAGDVRDTNIFVRLESSFGFPSIEEATIGGAMYDSQIRGLSRIGRFSARAMFNSSVFAGVPQSIGILPDSAAGIDTTVDIGSVTVSGLADGSKSFVGSLIVAGRIGTAFIAFPEQQNFGTPFGIAGSTIGSVSTKVSNSQTISAVNPSATLAPLGDYQVRVNFAPPA